jgi:hypothetical protein
MQLDMSHDDLALLGLHGADTYFAELIPAAEMAWADGEVQPNERALLEAYASDLIERLNREAGAPAFSGARAQAMLARLLQRRMRPYERHAALRLLSGRSREAKRRMLQWVEAVAAVDGHPVWDTRELFWLQAVRRTLGMVDGATLTVDGTAT